LISLPSTAWDTSAEVGVARLFQCHNTRLLSIPLRAALVFLSTVPTEIIKKDQRF